MNDSKLQPLKKMAAKIAVSDSPQDQMAALTHAFELFCLETKRLEGAYNSLKEEFTNIHYELEDANNKLKHHLAELDVMGAYHNRILNNISQGLLFIDLNGDVTTYNSAAEQILGVSISQALGYTFWKNFDDALFNFSIREALAKKQSPSLLFSTIYDKTKSRREIEITTTFVSEKATGDAPTVRKMQGVIVLMRDITEIRSLQKTAERNERMRELGVMAAMVAHEIRNPLGGIKGFASLLHRDLQNEPQMRQMAEHIIEGTDTLNRLVTNVLDYSRPVDPNKERVDLLVLIEELKRHIKADEKLSKGTKIVIVHDKEPLHLLLDRQLFKAAMLNLIANAIQSMPKGGEVTITITCENNQAIVKVADEGVGIAPENLEKIFTPFFTTKSEGTGFGLSEVHKVIQAHEGTIDVTSTLERGTTFTLALPIQHLKE